VLASRSNSNLADTNILADDLGRQIEQKYRLLANASNARSLICIVSLGEVRSLAIRWAWGATKLRALEDVLDQFVAIPLEFPGVVESYALIDNFCRTKGFALGKNDLWIAATARATGARLLTTDKDFDALDPGFLARDYIAP
jgi:predicted nucleic acid-binding protein